MENSAAPSFEVRRSGPLAYEPEPLHKPRHDDGELSPERVAVLARGVDLVFHSLRRLRIRAVARALGDGVPICRRVRPYLCLELSIQAGAPDAAHVGAHVHAHLAQERLRDAARRDARRRLARRRALENVARVVGAGLEHAHEVGMARARMRLALQVLGPCAHGGHTVSPVLVVVVYHLQRDRRAERRRKTHAGQDLHAVGLYDLPPASAVAALAPRQIVVDVVDIKSDARGDIAHDCRQRGPMRLARRDKLHVKALLLRLRQRSGFSVYQAACSSPRGAIAFADAR